MNVVKVGVGDVLGLRDLCGGCVVVVIVGVVFREGWTGRPGPCGRASVHRVLLVGVTRVVVVGVALGLRSLRVVVVRVALGLRNLCVGCVVAVVVGVLLRAGRTGRRPRGRAPGHRERNLVDAPRLGCLLDLRAHVASTMGVLWFSLSIVLVWHSSERKVEIWW